MSSVEFNPIEKGYQTIIGAVDDAYDAVGKFLDKNPTIYKIVLVACHFFRAIPMFAMMECMPLPAAAGVAGGSIAGALMYRAAVERFCCFRFAIPSMVGGGAAWLAKIAIVNYISGAAFSSLGAVIANTLLFIPMLSYTAWVIYLAHEDIEKRMELLGKAGPDPSGSCCETQTSGPEVVSTCCQTKMNIASSLV